MGKTAPLKASSLTILSICYRRLLNIEFVRILHKRMDAKKQIEGL